MINFELEKYCCGCSACYNVCPVHAINMNENVKGFLQPTITYDKCIKCGMCEKVCPHLNSGYGEQDAKIRAVWLYCSDNNEAKKRSSSGGACYELSKAMLEKGGYICGCAWDKSLNAEHIVGNDKVTLKALQGSKYVQSKMDTSYKEVIALLKAGKKVLFTGTPCQIRAIHNMVMNLTKGKYRELLITVAVICHGVASPRVWDSYKEYLSKENKSNLISVNFRDKTEKGYGTSYCYYEFQNGKLLKYPTFLPGSKYIEATLVYNLALRECCGHCDCKGANSGIDLIIGDWYAEYTGKGELGTSCIIAYTERGYQYAVNNLKELREEHYETIVKKNSFIEKSVSLSANREIFFENIQNNNYWERVEELYPTKYKLKKMLVKMRLYSVLKRIIG